jgi:parallel beta-helix repeat protein
MTASKSTARRTFAPPPNGVPGPGKIYATPILSILAGLLIAATLVAVTKPHWRDTGAGTVFGLGVVPEARTWRVKADIADTLARARPGDTIMVAPGTYPEQVRLRDGITLMSERPREAVLQTSGVAVVADAVQNARIEGFRIISDEGQPLTVGVQVNDSDATVLDMEISGAQTAGIEILGNSSGTFRANQISDNPGTGVIIRDNAKPRFVHNSITGNGRAPGTPRPGIEVGGSAQPSLYGNVIARNAAEPIWAPQLNLESLTRQNFVIPSQPARPQPRVRPSK